MPGDVPHTGLVCAQLLHDLPREQVVDDDPAVSAASDEIFLPGGLQGGELTSDQSLLDAVSAVSHHARVALHLPPGAHYSLGNPVHPGTV